MEEGGNDGGAKLCLIFTNSFAFAELPWASWVCTAVAGGGWLCELTQCYESQNVNRNYPQSILKDGRILWEWEGGSGEYSAFYPDIHKVLKMMILEILPTGGPLLQLPTAQADPRNFRRQP